ncbi:hypothetical protein ZYGR_0I01450 [Zygosaccharomyces rouxii]|uniref:ZYRO0C03454p n=2 Tax=Zygosaccharomyces rouxii TaxID=4956 RepID=C5DSW2_ZYGRC|nr:uncharacterized protein ZYRO0C03454g [Zygosaccharomyces rouxii]KAH9201937.1 hypothetical protein LQ764DRAFT_208674 [Zygosaccharomyces rouxii]GAV47849.1 hypothetical protein ZYGR_0I01450 [Zygosaccharomyces rouxii]CAR26873.1 ZYRO0C03454p [Zygosaccharomyces rouxii]
MVLPLIVGICVAGISLTARSGIRAWEIYKVLSPMTIARMNKVRIKESPKWPGTQRFLSSRLDPELQRKLNEYPGGFNPRMTESEAFLILNISPTEIEQLDEKMLKRKHRRAMVQNHPDKGGSPYLAIKINEARDVLEESCMVKKK